MLGETHRRAHLCRAAAPAGYETRAGACSARTSDRERPLPLRERVQRRELEPRATAPLTQPGVNVNAGEYLLAVGRRELPRRSVYATFEATAGKSGRPSVGEPRRFRLPRGPVVPVANESRCATALGSKTTADGRSAHRRPLAYVYLPNTAAGGFSTSIATTSRRSEERARSSTSASTPAASSPTTSSTSAGDAHEPIVLRDGEDITSAAGAIFGPRQ